MFEVVAQTRQSEQAGEREYLRALTLRLAAMEAANPQLLRRSTSAHRRLWREIRRAVNKRQNETS